MTYLALIILTLVLQEQAVLEIRFIGNDAFQISDGQITLISDFPYVSGVSGYMQYRMEDVEPTGEVVSLITHGHSDHFDAQLFSGTDWSIVGPPDVVAQVDAERAVQMRGNLATHGPLLIRALPTPHGDIEHYSYLVTWHDLKLYFTGDTGSLEQLLRMEDLDVLFITRWLYESAVAREIRLDTKQIIFCHHTEYDRPPSCPNCITPEQGQVIRVGPN